MKYVSIFSGIEAATVAWHPLGWEPLAFSEIDPFPSTVLQHHYPDIPNLGDITKIDWSPYVGAADIVVGGSPCQSFSVAGKREGLAGASGLMFEYIRAVRELRPRWFVWENVPGAFTSERGEAYRQLLSEMDALGYGLAWRVLDAQFFGVAQRRERVFLVGSLGTMRCAEVLFERESLSWDHQSSRQKRQALTEEAQERVGEADHDSGCLNPGETQSRRVYPASGVYPTLSTRENSGQSQESVFLCQTAQTGSNGKLVKQDDVMNTLDRTNSTAVAALDFKVKPVAFLYNQGAKARSLGISEISPTLKTDHNPAVAFASNQRDEVRELEVAGALAAQPGIKQQTYICRADGQANAMTSVDMAPTLTSHAKKDPPLIYPAEDSIGEGALIQRDMSATLSTHNIQTPITGGREKRGLTVRRLHHENANACKASPTITPISHIGTRNTLRTVPVTRRWATAWPYRSCDGSENAFGRSKKPPKQPVRQQKQVDRRRRGSDVPQKNNTAIGHDLVQDFLLSGEITRSKKNHGRRSTPQGKSSGQHPPRRSR